VGVNVIVVKTVLVLVVVGVHMVTIVWKVHIKVQQISIVVLRRTGALTLVGEFKKPLINK